MQDSKLKTALDRLSNLFAVLSFLSFVVFLFSGCGHVPGVPVSSFVLALQTFTGCGCLILFGVAVMIGIITPAE